MVRPRQELPGARERRLWVAEVARVRGGATGLSSAQADAVLRVLVSVAAAAESETPQTRLQAAELLQDLRAAIVPAPERRAGHTTRKPAFTLRRVA